MVSQNWDLSSSEILRSVDWQLPPFSGQPIGPILKMVPISCPETSTSNRQLTLRNIPEERRSHSYREGGLKFLKFSTKFCRTGQGEIGQSLGLYQRRQHWPTTWRQYKRTYILHALSAIRSMIPVTKLCNLQDTGMRWHFIRPKYGPNIT